MKHKALALFLGLTAAASLALSASATSQKHEVPVTLTIVNTEQRLSVTVPAALPVSVVDGYVVTATNAAIRNTARLRLYPGNWGRSCSRGPTASKISRTSPAAGTPSPCPSTVVPPAGREIWPSPTRRSRPLMQARPWPSSTRSRWGSSEVSAVKAATVVFTIAAAE